MIWNEIMAYPCLSLIASPSSSRSNTSLFHMLCTYSHLFYPSLSLLTTFQGYLRNGLIAPAPLMIQYGQSDTTSQTLGRSPSPTSLSPTLTTPYPLLLFHSNHSDSNQNDYISLFLVYFHPFGMILHWILAYRFSITCCLFHYHTLSPTLHYSIP